MWMFYCCSQRNTRSHANNRNCKATERTDKRNKVASHCDFQEDFENTVCRNGLHKTSGCHIFKTFCRQLYSHAYNCLVSQIKNISTYLRTGEAQFNAAEYAYGITWQE